jgi:hypothetical protein
MYLSVLSRRPAIVSTSAVNSQILKIGTGGQLLGFVIEETAPLVMDSFYSAGMLEVT